MFRTHYYFLAMFLATLPGVAASPESAHISGVVYDLGTDRPVSNTAIEIVSYANCESTEEVARISTYTGEHGEFEVLLPVGKHGLRVIAFSELKPVPACIDFASREQIARCSSSLHMTAPFRNQALIVRTASVSSKYPPDVRSEHPCAQRSLGICAPLSLPDKVLSKRVLFLDEENRPVADAILEFHAHSVGLGVGPGELFGSVITDSAGGTDLRPIYTQQQEKGYRLGFDDVILNKWIFQLDLSAPSEDPLQIIRLVKWRCDGVERVQAVPQQPPLSARPTPTSPLSP